MINPIITVSELRDQLKISASAQHTVVLDCRFSLADPELGERQYREGHIPGAYYFHLNRDLSSDIQDHGGRHPLPNPVKLASKLRSSGINAHTQVVVYDDSSFAFAARAWWLLRYLGHANVQVLNGGFQAWREAGLAIDRRTPAARSGKLIPEINADWIVDIDTVKKISDGVIAALLVDAREERRYQGLEEPIDPVAGHIPGALNFPWQGVSDSNGFALPADIQQDHWQQLLQDLVPENDLVVYCGSGVTACVDLLSLAMTGRQAKLYPGSWSDWCSYPETQKETVDTAGID